MPQQALDYRRLTPAQRAQFIPGYETMSRQPGGVADAAMLARHEHRARQPGSDRSRAAAALELRRRQLELLKLTAAG